MLLLGNLPHSVRAVKTSAELSKHVYFIVFIDKYCFTLWKEKSCIAVLFKQYAFSSFEKQLTSLVKWFKVWGKSVFRQ